MEWSDVIERINTRIFSDGEIVQYLGDVVSCSRKEMMSEEETLFLIGYLKFCNGFEKLGWEKMSSSFKNQSINLEYQILYDHLQADHIFLKSCRKMIDFPNVTFTHYNRVMEYGKSLIRRDTLNTPPLRRNFINFLLGVLVEQSKLVHNLTEDVNKKVNILNQIRNNLNTVNEYMEVEIIGDSKDLNFNRQRASICWNIHDYGRMMKFFESYRPYLSQEEKKRSILGYQTLRARIGIEKDRRIKDYFEVCESGLQNFIEVNHVIWNEKKRKGVKSKVNVFTSESYSNSKYMIENGVFCYIDEKVGSKKKNVVRTIFGVPSNLKFEYVDIGNDFAISTNILMSSRLLLFWKGQIVSKITDTDTTIFKRNKPKRSSSRQKVMKRFFVFLGTGYLLILPPSTTHQRVVRGPGSPDILDDTMIVGDDVSLYYQSFKLPPEDIIFEENRELSVDVLPGNFFGQVGKSSKTILFWMRRNLKGGEGVRRFTDSRFRFLNRSATVLLNSLLEDEKYVFMSSFETWVKNLERGVHSFDTLRYPHLKFTQFSSLYQNFIINLHLMNRDDDCVFSEISQDVLCHNIIPFIGESDIIHFELRSYFRILEINENITDYILEKKIPQVTNEDYRYILSEYEDDLSELLKPPQESQLEEEEKLDRLMKALYHIIRLDLNLENVSIRKKLGIIEPDIHPSIIDEEKKKKKDKENDDGSLYNDLSRLHSSTYNYENDVEKKNTIVENKNNVINLGDSLVRFFRHFFLACDPQVISRKRYFEFLTKPLYFMMTSVQIHNRKNERKMRNEIIQRGWGRMVRTDRIKRINHFEQSESFEKILIHCLKSSSSSENASKYLLLNLEPFYDVFEKVILRIIDSSRGEVDTEPGKLLFFFRLFELFGNGQTISCEIIDLVLLFATTSPLFVSQEHYIQYSNRRIEHTSSSSRHGCRDIRGVIPLITVAIVDFIGEFVLNDVFVVNNNNNKSKKGRIEKICKVLLDISSCVSSEGNYDKSMIRNCLETIQLVFLHLLEKKMTCIEDMISYLQSKSSTYQKTSNMKEIINGEIIRKNESSLYAVFVPFFNGKEKFSFSNNVELSRIKYFSILVDLLPMSILLKCQYKIDYYFINSVLRVVSEKMLQMKKSERKKGTITYQYDIKFCNDFISLFLPSILKYHRKLLTFRKSKQFLSKLFMEEEEEAEGEEEDDDDIMEEGKEAINTTIEEKHIIRKMYSTEEQVTEALYIQSILLMRLICRFNILSKKNIESPEYSFVGSSNSSGVGGQFDYWVESSDSNNNSKGFIRVNKEKDTSFSKTLLRRRIRTNDMVIMVSEIILQFFNRITRPSLKNSNNPVLFLYEYVISHVVSKEQERESYKAVQKAASYQTAYRSSSDTVWNNSWHSSDMERKVPKPKTDFNFIYRENYNGVFRSNNFFDLIRFFSFSFLKDNFNRRGRISLDLNNYNFPSFVLSMKGVGEIIRLLKQSSEHTDIGELASPKIEMYKQIPNVNSKRVKTIIASIHSLNKYISKVVEKKYSRVFDFTDNLSTLFSSSLSKESKIPSNDGEHVEDIIIYEHCMKGEDIQSSVSFCMDRLEEIRNNIHNPRRTSSGKKSDDDDDEEEEEEEAEAIELGEDEWKEVDAVDWESWKGGVVVRESLRNLNSKENVVFVNDLIVSLNVFQTILYNILDDSNENSNNSILRTGNKKLKDDSSSTKLKIIGYTPTSTEFDSEFHFSLCSMPNYQGLSLEEIRFFNLHKDGNENEKWRINNVKETKEEEEEDKKRTFENKSSSSTVSTFSLKDYLKSGRESDLKKLGEFIPRKSLIRFSSIILDLFLFGNSHVSSEYHFGSFVYHNFVNTFLKFDFVKFPVSMVYFPSRLKQINEIQQQRSSSLSKPKDDRENESQTESDSSLFLWFDLSISNFLKFFVDHPDIQEMEILSDVEDENRDESSFSAELLLISLRKFSCDVSTILRIRECGVLNQAVPVEFINKETIKEKIRKYGEWKYKATIENFENCSLFSETKAFQPSRERKKKYRRKKIQKGISGKVIEEEEDFDLFEVQKEFKLKEEYMVNLCNLLNRKGNSYDDKELNYYFLHHSSLKKKIVEIFDPIFKRHDMYSIILLHQLFTIFRSIFPTIPFGRCSFSKPFVAPSSGHGLNHKSEYGMEYIEVENEISNSSTNIHNSGRSVWGEIDSSNGGKRDEDEDTTKSLYDKSFFTGLGEPLSQSFVTTLLELVETCQKGIIHVPGHSVYFDLVYDVSAGLIYEFFDTLVREKSSPSKNNNSCCKLIEYFTSVEFVKLFFDGMKILGLSGGLTKTDNIIFFINVIQKIYILDPKTFEGYNDSYFLNQIPYCMYTRIQYVSGVDYDEFLRLYEKMLVSIINTHHEDDQMIGLEEFVAQNLPFVNMFWGKRGVEHHSNLEEFVLRKLESCGVEKPSEIIMNSHFSKREDEDLLVTNQKEIISKEFKVVNVDNNNKKNQNEEKEEKEEDQKTNELSFDEIIKQHVDQSEEKLVFSEIKFNGLWENEESQKDNKGEEDLESIGRENNEEVYTFVDSSNEQTRTQLHHRAGNKNNGNGNVNNYDVASQPFSFGPDLKPDVSEETEKKRKGKEQNKSFMSFLLGDDDKSERMYEKQPSLSSQSSKQNEKKLRSKKKRGGARGVRGAGLTTGKKIFRRRRENKAKLRLSGERKKGWLK